MSTHRIATFGLMLLVTLTMGAYAEQVEPTSSIPCPLVQPADGDACLPFADSFCTYGEFCCPGDSTTAESCVPETTCYCEGAVTYCFQRDFGVPLPCPSICPVEPPKTNDACNISSQFSCRYGDAFVCDEENGPSYEYEKECVCEGDQFFCIENVCPVACPATKPVEGDTCALFTDGSCDYDEFCCPDGGADAGTCVIGTTCYCDESTMTIACFEPPVVCPSLCPATRPNETDNNADVCNVLGERYQCEYDLVDGCPADSWIEDGGVAKDMCSCTGSGAVSCYDNCMRYDTAEGGQPSNGGHPTQGHNQNKENKKKKDKNKKKERKNSKTKKHGKARKLLRSPLKHAGRDSPFYE